MCISDGVYERSSHAAKITQEKLLGVSKSACVRVWSLEVYKFYFSTPLFFLHKASLYYFFHLKYLAVVLFYSKSLYIRTYLDFCVKTNLRSSMNLNLSWRAYHVEDVTSDKDPKGSFPVNNVKVSLKF